MDEKKTTTTGARTASSGPAGARRRSARRLLGATATGMLAALALGAPANAALTGVGPTNADTGFPDWYQDQSGLRLELCVRNEDPFCTSTAPNPGPPTVAADPADSNFPEETFYWSGDALIDKRAVGVRARLVLAQEAAFVNGTPTKGDQMTFGRIRVRIDGAKPGADYTITHPYGTEHLTADSRGRVRMTDDVGCAAAPCNFREAMATRIGPFLRWDPATDPQAPAGYVGNPLREHTVVGSPRGASFNVFRVTGPDIGGPGDNMIETHLFTIEGKAAAVQGTPSRPAPGGGTAPAPGGTTPAPGGTAPAPGGTTPAPGGTAPAPGGGTTPAPAPGGGTTPAPAPGGGTTPAPAPGGGTTPAPAPGGGTTPAPAPPTLPPLPHLPLPPLPHLPGLPF